MKYNTQNKSKMKANFKLSIFFASLILFFSACSSDDENPSVTAPVISDFEYGAGSEHSTDRVAYKGSDIHLEAAITAEAVVKSISVDIHSDDVTPAEGEVEWHFEQSYTDATYLVKNPTFHEHIDVPSDIPAGEYHIVLTVTDEMGNSTETEAHLQILDVIAVSDFSMDESVVRGEDFHVEFQISAIHGIHELMVDVHAHGLTVGEGEVEWDGEFNYGEKYHEATEAEFHEHIDVPVSAPVGEYHIKFTITDEEGNTFDYEAHIDVVAP
ncbi:Conserved hypothetical lipoprotein [Zobellia galactanivorans]|uniref:Conserved hypothetical lipoprotein n=2 Tax=Flavobacteriaceae TaxID=49546 RepID=G0LBU7_ZOBGA|nr:Conserved hypothetical lipoprotein [Zobellia galactanivorans]